MIVTRAAIAFAVITAVLIAAGTTTAQQIDLKPRQKVPRTPTAQLTIPVDATGRLIVKFNDEVKARSLANGKIISLVNEDVEEANKLLSDLGLTLKPAINFNPEQMAKIEARAATRSGFMQPDLAGIFHIDGPEAALLTAARALNKMNTEWVSFETKRYPAYRRGPTGACCIDEDDCQVISNADCDTAGGYYQGDGVPCGMSTCARGACCLAGGGLGDCDDGLTRDQCIALGSSSFFPGADCDIHMITDLCIIRVCCLPDETCILLTSGDCAGQGGNFDGGLTSCEDVECDNDCGNPTVGNCWDPANPSVFCDDGFCCNLVCTFDPFCCDEDNPTASWDKFCVAEANLLCAPHTPNWDLMTEMIVNDPPMGPDRCASPLNGNCFEPHLDGGCNNQVCCNIVCDMFSFCCDGIWSPFCVLTAQQECVTNDDMVTPTPDYTVIQGYLTVGGYLGGVPADLLPYVPNTGGTPFCGFAGEGMNFQTAGEAFTDDGYDGMPNTDDLGEGNEWRDPPEPFDDFGVDGENNTFDAGEGDFVWQAGEPFEDLNGDGTWTDGEAFVDGNGDQIWNPPGGLWGIAEQLRQDDGVDSTGLGNLTRGRAAKFAVIEWAYHENHEDLQHINLERNQRLILTEGSGTEPNHGTACLSIIGAEDETLDNQPRKGVTGIVPEAEGWFFPLTSVEEGPREMSAWFAAIAELGPGDVISASYGPGPPIGNLNNDTAMNTIFRVARDLGITVCVAAGNDCFNLDNAPDLGDSGAIVVGACSPGFPHFRLSFSNYYTTADPTLARSNIVHVKAWGESVVAAGYGLLFYGNPGGVDRSYTPVFGGTSAASPQIAGLVIALQGLAKQFYGIPFNGPQIRSIMGAPGAVPNPPSRALLNGGFPEGQACNLDLDPDSGPNLVGPYPSPTQAAQTVLTQTGAGFDSAPLVDDVVIVRGDLIGGNKWSIKGDDNLYLEVEAVHTERDTVPGQDQIGGQGGGVVPPISIPEVQEIKYLATGDITDIVVVANADVPDIGTMIVENQVRWPNVFAIMFVEAYDWRFHRWSFVDLSVDGAGFTGVDPDNGDLTFEHTAAGPSRFVREADNRILIRSWYLGFPTIGSFGGQSDLGDSKYTARYDLINVFVAEQSGVGLP